MDDERFSVSGWEDDLSDIDISRNPSDKSENEILAAAETGDLAKIKSLLEQNPNLVHTTDKDKYTPLHRACYANQKEVVAYLVLKGANIGAKTEMLWEPLHCCCQWNTTECAAILLQNGADVNAQSQGGQTPLHIAASHGVSYDTVQLLLMHPYIRTDIRNNSNELPQDIARRSSKYYNIFDMADPLLSLENLDDFLMPVVPIVLCSIVALLFFVACTKECSFKLYKQ